MDGQWFPKQPIQFEGDAIALLDPFAATYRASITDTANAASYSGGSWSGISIGTAPTGSNKRFVLVLFNTTISAGSHSVTGITFGGVSATVVQTTAGAGVSGYAILEVNTGTTVDIALTTSATIDGVNFSVYTLLNPGTGATPYSEASSTTHASGVITLSTNVPSGGFAAAACMTRNNAASTLSWNGTMTSRVNTDLEAEDDATIADTTTAGTPSTITCTCSDTTPQSMRGYAVAWGP